MNRILTAGLVITVVVALGISLLNPAHTSIAPTEDTWNTKTPLPTPTFRLGAAVVDEKIYAIGGFNQTWGTQNTNLMYDPETDTWTAMAPMPTPRALFGIAIHQNKIYAIGGVTQAHEIPWGSGGISIDKWTAATEVYDPKTNTWETKQPMPTATFRLQSNVVAGKIYLNTPFSNLTEIYDPASDSWSTATPMPNPQENFASAVADDKIYHISDQTQIFDPKTEQWTIGSPPQYPVYQGAAAAIAHNTTIQIYLFGGNLTQIYNPTNDTWTTGAAMPTSRVNLAAAVLNNTIYVIGGTSGTPDEVLATNEQYIPAGYVATHPTTIPTDPIQPSLTTPIAIATIVAVVTITILATLIIYTKKHHKQKSQLT